MLAEEDDDGLLDELNHVVNVLTPDERAEKKECFEGDGEVGSLGCLTDEEVFNDGEDKPLQKEKYLKWGEYYAMSVANQFRLCCSFCFSVPLLETEAD